MDIKNIHVPYDSPIEVNIINDMMNQTINKVMEDMDNAIYKSVVHAGFNVEKDKLVEVFTQDKRRYEEAYRKGYAQRDADIIRCKNCKHRPHDKRGHGVSEDLLFPDDVCPLQCDDPWYSKYPEDDFFCAKGERRY